MSSFRHSRRALLRSAAGTGLLLAGGFGLPAISRAADRPQISHGLQSGDVTGDSAVLWVRVDRPADLLVEVATSDSFVDARRLPPMHALPACGQAARGHAIEDLLIGRQALNQPHRSLTAGILGLINGLRGPPAAAVSA